MSKVEPNTPGFGEHYSYKKAIQQAAENLPDHLTRDDVASIYFGTPKKGMTYRDDGGMNEGYLVPNIRYGFPKDIWIDNSLYGLGPTTQPKHWSPLGAAKMYAQHPSPAAWREMFPATGNPAFEHAYPDEKTQDAMKYWVGHTADKIRRHEYDPDNPSRESEWPDVFSPAEILDAIYPEEYVRGGEISDEELSNVPDFWKSILRHGGPYF